MGRIKFQADVVQLEPEGSVDGVCHCDAETRDPVQLDRVILVLNPPFGREEELAEGNLRRRGETMGL